MASQGDCAASGQESEGLDKDLEQLKREVSVQYVVDIEKEDAVILMKLNRAISIVHKSALGPGLRSLNNREYFPLVVSLASAVLAKMK